MSSSLISRRLASADRTSLGAELGMGRQLVFESREDGVAEGRPERVGVGLLASSRAGVASAWAVTRDAACDSTRASTARWNWSSAAGRASAVRSSRPAATTGACRDRAQQGIAALRDLVGGNRRGWRRRRRRTTGAPRCRNARRAAAARASAPRDGQRRPPSEVVAAAFPSAMKQPVTPVEADVDLHSNPRNVCGWPKRAQPAGRAPDGAPTVTRVSVCAGPGPQRAGETMTSTSCST